MNILTTPIEFFKTAINNGSERTIKIKKNILISFVFRLGNILISLALIPLSLTYINTTEYGILLTLTSIVAWFSFFDIGFGHGLRNKLTESIAKGQYRLSRIYISTTYAILAVVVIIIFIIFIIINPHLNWSRILNAETVSSNELRLLALIIFATFCIQFILQLLTTIMTANQQPSKAFIFNFWGSLLSLLTIFILTKTTSGSIIYLTLALTVPHIIVLIFSSFWFYTRSYKKYLPTLKYVKFKYAKKLISLGVLFFIIQISGLVLFQTDNIIVSQLFGPKEVTIFNIMFKLFSVITMIFTIIATPLWSAFTDAYTKEDFAWMKNILRKMKKVWFLLILATISLYIVYPLILNVWLGKAIKPDALLALALCAYVISYSWQTIHVFFLNGVGKIRLQLCLVILSAIINIPIAIVWGKSIGLAGIVLSNAFVFTIMGFLFSVQTKKILSKTAKGIWAK